MQQIRHRTVLPPVPASLTDSLTALLTTGEVMVASQLAPFTADDLAAATTQLCSYHADNA